MTTTQGDLAGLSRFIFRAPSWYTSLLFALLIAAVAGIAAFESAQSVTTWRGVFILGRDAWEGIFFIGVPTVVAAFGTTGVDRFVGGKLTANRSSLLALVSEVILVVVVTAAAVISVFTGLDQRFVYDVLVIALASIFALRLLVVMAVSRSSLLVAAIPASIQPGAAAALLFVYSGTLRYLSVGGPILNAYLTPHLARASQAPPELLVISADHFVLLGITSGVYGLAVYGFIIVVDRPWRRSLGVSVLDFLRGFIGHVAEGSRELEEFFEELGEEALVPVSVLSIIREDGSEKARFVLPMIHPGPMGEIGGGNLPERVAVTADGLAFPPHATAGHDFNLVTESEVDTIIESVEAAASRITYASHATESRTTDAGEVSMLGQAFGENAIMVSSFAPGFADDIEYGVGLSVATEARASGLDNVVLVDAHNSNDGLDGPEIGHVTPGSARAFDMMNAASHLGLQLRDADQYPLHVGTAWDRTPWDPADGIGPLGVRVAVFSVNEQETGYILIDGNNMEPGLRDAIRHRIVEQGHIDQAEIMTTDTHIVNTVEADNQVGSAIEDEQLICLIEELVEKARADCEPVKAGIAVERAAVTVFGNDRTETLASHANAVVAMGGAFAVSVTMAAVAVSVLIFLFA
jgi:putative membrane protein